MYYLSLFNSFFSSAVYSSAGIVRTPLVLLTEYSLSYSEEKGYAPDEVDLRVVDLGSYETCLFYFQTKTHFSQRGEL